MKKTAEELYHTLVNEYKIVGKQGGIKFKLHDLEIDIEARDSVGNLIQEWLGNWMTKYKIDFTRAGHTQDFPDFFLDKERHTTGLLELKSFDYDRGANFDVANFMAYRRSLVENSYRLDSKYLIIGYKMNGQILEIANVWLKSVWEITGPSTDWPLKCQVKQGEIFNIRPVKWYDNGGTTFKPFNSALAFVNAFDETARQWPATARDKVTGTWLTKVKQNYKKATGRDLS